MWQTSGKQKRKITFDLTSHFVNIKPEEYIFSLYLLFNLIYNTSSSWSLVDVIVSIVFILGDELNFPTSILWIAVKGASTNGK